MQQLSNQNLEEIQGGAIKGLGVWAIAGAIITFTIGFLNGLIRPYSCTDSK